MPLYGLHDLCMVAALLTLDEPNKATYYMQPSFVCNLYNHQLKSHDLDPTSEVFFT